MAPDRQSGRGRGEGKVPLAAQLLEHGHLEREQYLSRCLYGVLSKLCFALAVIADGFERNAKAGLDLLIGEGRLI
jgi:hypothetical protein